MKFRAQYSALLVERKGAKIQKIKLVNFKVKNKLSLATILPKSMPITDKGISEIWVVKNRSSVSINWVNPAITKPNHPM